MTSATPSPNAPGTVTTLPTTSNVEAASVNPNAEPASPNPSAEAASPNPNPNAEPAAPNSALALAAATLAAPKPHEVAGATLTAADVDRLARLARIDIGSDEREAVRRQLNRVFGILERLRAVDTTGVEPLTHPQAEALRQRQDEVTEADRRAENQRLAPAVEHGLYLVPRVID